MFAGGSISERDTPPRELLRDIEAQIVVLGLLEEQWALNSVGALPYADAAMVIFLRMLEVRELSARAMSQIPFFYGCGCRVVVAVVADDDDAAADGGGDDMRFKVRVVVLVVIIQR